MRNVLDEMRVMNEFLQNTFQKTIKKQLDNMEVMNEFLQNCIKKQLVKDYEKIKYPDCYSFGGPCTDYS